MSKPIPKFYKIIQGIEPFPAGSICSFYTKHAILSRLSRDEQQLMVFEEISLDEAKNLEEDMIYADQIINKDTYQPKGTRLIEAPKPPEKPDHIMIDGKKHYFN